MKKISKRLVAILVSVLLVVPFMMFQASAATYTTVTVAASKTALHPGDNFDVTVTFQNMPSYGIGGFTLNLPVSTTFIDSTGSYTAALNGGTGNPNQGSWNAGGKYVITYVDLTYGTKSIPCDNGNGQLVGTFHLHVSNSAPLTTSTIGSITVTGMKGYPTPGTNSPITVTPQYTTQSIPLTFSSASTPVSSIAIAPTAISMYTNSTNSSLSATVAPSNASNQLLTWNSSNTAVATVSSAGVVTSGSTTGTTMITATATDGSGIVSNSCAVTVTNPPSQYKQITAFSLAGNAGVINEANHTIAVTVPYGSSLTGAPSITLYDGFASVLPASGVSENFASPVTYTVTAQDGTTQPYVVTVTVAKNSADSITALTILGYNGVINGNSIVVTVPAGTNVTSVVPSITASLGATVSPTTAQDFTSSVTYTVTAENGTSQQAYTVSVVKATALVPQFTLTTSDGVNFSLALSQLSVNYKYQIWAQEQYANGMTYWLLVKGFDDSFASYSAASETATATWENDSSNLSTYKVLVRVKDDTNNISASQYTSEITPAAAGQLKITSVKLDGVVPTTSVFKTAGSTLTIGVTTSKACNYIDYNIGGVDVPDQHGTTCTYTVPSVSGTYKVIVTAANSINEQDTATESFIVLGSANAPYLTGINAPATVALNTPVAISLNSNSNGVSKVNYNISISEPLLNPLTGFLAPVSYSSHSYSFAKSGLYEISGSIQDPNSPSKSDNETALIRVVRPSGQVKVGTVAITKNGSPFSGSAINKNDILTFTPPANGNSYSFWRLDASGWVQVLDYTVNGTLIWSPTADGIYSIEVRVKASNSGSFEDYKAFDYTVGTIVADPSLTFSSVINPDNRSVKFTASTSLASDTLEYMFSYSTTNWADTFQQYSSSNVASFAPVKTGDYVIKIDTKDATSGGIYDNQMSKTVHIVVNADGTIASIS